jgi:hypothetical protein
MWMTRTGDQGLVNEPEMIQRMWPGGIQPETAAPYIISRRSADVKREPSLEVTGPTELVIYVPTQGASIGYTDDEGPTPKWRLYTGPIRVTGPTTIRAKAIRYGYKESVETRMVVTSGAGGVGR